MILDPMIPVFGGVLLFLAVAAFIVVTGISGPRRGRVTRIARRLGIALALLIVGLRPGIPDAAERVVIASDVDVFVAFDTTGSVAAEDYDGSRPRLEGMRADVEQIVEAFPGARISLVTFDSVAIIRVPLTRDASTLLSAMDVLRPEITGYSSGSTISEPVSLLEETLENAAEANPDHSRVLIYLGDGEQTASGEPASFESLAPYLEGGAVLGYGTAAGGRMLENKGAFYQDEYYYDDEYYEEDDKPAPTPTYIQDYSSYPTKDARSTIDEGNLQAIAEQLGVGYEHRTAPGEIAAIDGLDQPGEVTLANVGAGMQEFYWIFALIAFALLLWEAGVVTVAIVEAFAASRRRA